MKKFFAVFTLALILASAVLPASASADVEYTVASGDSMWRIAVKHQVGVREIINANRQVKNPDLIYPGQRLTIPLTDSSVRGFEQEVIRLVNDIRKSNGLGTLTENWELSRVARIKSQDMRDKHYFAHESPTYGTPFEMIKSFGLSYRSAGENIAKGYETPERVVDGWMKSSGHRANILKESYTQIGVGYVESGNYWTQMFMG